MYTRVASGPTAYDTNVFRLHVTALRALGLPADSPLLAGYGVKAGYKLPADQWQPHYWWKEAHDPRRVEMTKQIMAGGYPGPEFPYTLFQSESIREFMT